MSPYIAILPNSPLLLHAFEHGQFPETKKSFQKVHEELKKRDIRHVLTISSSPRIERDSASLYVHPEYELSFADFGDLITKSKVPVWWDAYNLIQSSPSSIPPVELIDEAKLDFGHAVPIQLVESFSTPQQKRSYLCLNTHHETAEQDQIALGGLLLEALSQLEYPFAIFIFGSLYQTTSAHLIKPVQVKNSDLRSNLINGNLELPPSPEDASIMKPSLLEPLQLITPFLHKGFTIKELSFEKDHRTSFLSAEAELTS